ncbi:hypothetical protein ACTXMK_02805 [Psychrobacter celer]|uniref:hypothetical protein n=1 Tax=Psychrobacter celer TaxID=306572 RepID=UPI003FD42EE9
MIDGMWWLVILFTVIAALWLLAKSRGTKTDAGRSGKQSNQLPSNDALQKTSVLFKQFFPDYQVTRKAKHLLIRKHNKKVAMITIDKTLAAGQRRLGDISVINYHRVPSRAQLATHLQEAE